MNFDATSNDILLAVAQGTQFPGATFIAYDGVISPEAELYRYILSSILFTSLSVGQLGETVSIQAGTAALVAGPASVPEPASALFFLTGGAALIGRWRPTRLDERRLRSHGSRR